MGKELLGLHLCTIVLDTVQSFMISFIILRLITFDDDDDDDDGEEIVELFCVLRLLNFLPWHLTSE